MDSTVEALLVEREGYVRRGRMDRVAQVDEQLARFGIEVEPAAETPEKASRSRRK